MLFPWGVDSLCIEMVNQGENHAAAARPIEAVWIGRWGMLIRCRDRGNVPRPVLIGLLVSQIAA